VDDGKSTLIGRLLHDAGLLFDDQLAAVRRDSERRGTAIDLSLVTDGLKAEREQGITIDVAYRYFSTDRRKFIIADTPGHEQYTRNMATGASNCDLAVVLVDARHGVLRQTRRHSFIASLLGIKHLVVAVNKMDLVGYDEAAFARIKDDFTAFAGRLEVPDVRFIPLSALRGDNVVVPSVRMPWYTGETLMYLLETVHIASDRNLIDFRFPVQSVIRAQGNVRGFCGTVASGVVRSGDAIVILPSGRHTAVRSIVTYEGEIPEAPAGMAVTVTLEDEVDVSRGDLLAHPWNVPRLAQDLEAMVVWMDEDPLAPGRPYLLKHGGRQVSATVNRVRYRIDVTTMHREATSGLNMNEVGRCEIVAAQPLPVDPYTTNRATGAFILIDRLSNRTVAAGMILDRRTAEGAIGDRPAAAGMEEAPGVAETAARPPAPTVILTGAAAEAAGRALERDLTDRGIDAVLLLAAGGAGASYRAARALTDAGIVCISVVGRPDPGPPPDSPDPGRIVGPLTYDTFGPGEARRLIDLVLGGR
jgi:bifunctional enzyme CysN/CysC